MFTRDNTEFIVFADQGQRYVSIYYNDDEVMDPEKGFQLRRADYDLDDDKNPDVQQILKLWTFEEIELNTRELKKQERKSFEAEVLAIAKKEGLIPTEQKAFEDVGDKTTHFLTNTGYEEVDPNIPLEDLIFNWDEKNEEQKESLFQLKLKIFDIDKVQKSKKKTAKTNLRKAQTPIDVLIAYSKF